MRSASGEMRAVQIRDFALSDASAIAKILSESPEASHWPEETFQDGLPKGTWAQVAMGNETVVGFLVGRRAADEFEILNLAVLPDYRHRGIGSKLMNSALQVARKSGCRRCYIEVRASNDSAISFYSRHGFQYCGRRVGYYRKPAEDALLFVRRENQV